MSNRLRYALDAVDGDLDRLRECLEDGRIKLDVRDYDNPGIELKPFPRELMWRYVINPNEGTITTSGDSPDLPMPAKKFLITDVRTEPETSARLWFRTEVKKALRNPRLKKSRDWYANEVYDRFGCSKRYFLNSIWPEETPAEWRRSGRPTQ